MAGAGRKGACFTFLGSMTQSSLLLALVCAGGRVAWGPNVSAGDPIQPETRREVLMDTYHGHTGGCRLGRGFRVGGIQAREASGPLKSQSRQGKAGLLRFDQVRAGMRRVGPLEACDGRGGTGVRVGAAACKVV